MNKKIVFLFLYSLVFISCSSKKPTLKSEVKKTDSSEYFQFISSERLTTNLTVIASDEMEGRDTGTEGQKKAGRYMIDFYKKNGISFPKGATSYYQPIPASYLNAKYNENLKDSENIWAYIEGSEKPEEIVVISAHYDHIGIKGGEVYNGADDDGSGTVALMEIAAAFQKQKMKVMAQNALF